MQAAVVVERAVARPFPAQIPACGFPAPGSSDSLAWATRYLRSVRAIPHSEVCLANPAHQVRSRFPSWATAAREPLPLVSQLLTRPYLAAATPGMGGWLSLPRGDFHPSRSTRLAWRTNGRVQSREGRAALASFGPPCPHVGCNTPCLGAAFPHRRN